MKRLYYRKDWHARDPRSLTRQRPPTEAFLHHGAEFNARNIDHLPEQIRSMQETQNFHMDVRGWSDIAYHYMVFQPFGDVPGARAFAGRYVRYVPAAQLGHNTGTLAICIYGNLEDELVRDDTAKVVAGLIRRHSSVRSLGGHRQVFGTTCPGRHGMEAIPRIAKLAGVGVRH